MKKVVLALFTFSLILGGCSQNETSAESSSTETIESSEKESISLGIDEPKYSLEDNTFEIFGKADPSKSVTISLNDEKIDEVTPLSSNLFVFEFELPDTEDAEYIISDGVDSEKVLIKSKSTMETEIAEAEKKKQEEEKKKAEAEAKAKEQAEKEAEEQRKKDEEQAKIAEERRKKEEIINNATREQRNALNKAIDYLDYSSFSRSGLYDQLIFEQYPDDAAQFAVDNIEVDWNEQALGKAIDYLDYSSFSDSGLYDQLIFEGFTNEQAQYAIDNLPD